MAELLVLTALWVRLGKPKTLFAFIKSYEDFKKKCLTSKPESDILKS